MPLVINVHLAFWGFPHRAGGRYKVYETKNESENEGGWLRSREANLDKFITAHHCIIPPTAKYGMFPLNANLMFGVKFDITILLFQCTFY